MAQTGDRAQVGGDDVKFIIDEKLPSLNDYTKACRANKYQGAEFKRRTQEVIGAYILLAKAMKRLYAQKNKATISFEWHEKTQKRDADNIASAKKFILDA